MLSVRPKITELVYRLYGRSLHPELFEIYETNTIERGGYKAVVRITSAGHLVQWQYQGLTLTEVATAAHHPLPQHRRLIAHRIKGRRSDRLECRGGITYEVDFSLEPTDREKFLAYERELTLQSTRTGLFHRFDASGRVGVGAMSYVNVESRDKSLRVRAFHTFPDDCAVLRTQSWFRLPG